MQIVSAAPRTMGRYPELTLLALAPAAVTCLDNGLGHATVLGTIVPPSGSRTPGVGT
eukprot:gene12238-10540_t